MVATPDVNAAIAEATNITSRQPIFSNTSRYSYTGNSKAIANSLSSQITADQLEIQPAEKGLHYEANGYALGTQLLNAIKANPNDASSYPAIDPVTASLDNYQNIIIVKGAKNS